VLKHFEIKLEPDLSPQALANEYTAQLDGFILSLGSDNEAPLNRLEATLRNQAKVQGVAHG